MPSCPQCPHLPNGKEALILLPSWVATRMTQGRSMCFGGKWSSAVGGLPLGQGGGPWQGGSGLLGLGQMYSSLWASVSTHVNRVAPGLTGCLH